MRVNSYKMAKEEMQLDSNFTHSVVRLTRLHNVPQHVSVASVPRVGSFGRRLIKEILDWYNV